MGNSLRSLSSIYQNELQLLRMRTASRMGNPLSEPKNRWSQIAYSAELFDVEAPFAFPLNNKISRALLVPPRASLHLPIAFPLPFIPCWAPLFVLKNLISPRVNLLRDALSLFFFKLTHHRRRWVITGVGIRFTTLNSPCSIASLIDERPLRNRRVIVLRKIQSLLFTLSVRQGIEHADRGE